MQQPNSHSTFRFGEFELDISAYQLRRGGHPVHLERHPMDLLILLVERRRQLVSRADIVKRLWDPSERRSGTPFVPIRGSPTCFAASASRRKLVSWTWPIECHTPGLLDALQDFY
jgi:hypothetical protein